MRSWKTRWVVLKTWYRSVGAGASKFNLATVQYYSIVADASVEPCLDQAVAPRDFAPEIEGRCIKNTHVISSGETHIDS